MSGFSGEEILNDFIKEVQGYIPGLEEGLVRLHENSGQADATREMHRLVHIIKGASAMLGLKKLSEAANYMEDALEEIMDGRTIPSKKLLGAMGGTIGRFKKFCDPVPEKRLDEDRLLAETRAAFENLILQEGDSIAPSVGTSNEIPLAEQVDFHSPDQLVGVDDLQPIEKEGTDDGQQPDLFFDEEPDLAALHESSVVDPGLPPEIMDDFLQEAEEHLEDVAKSLNRLESLFPEPGPIGEQDRELLRRIRRSVHTIKGASAVVGLEAVSGWAHQMEDLLDWLYESANVFQPETARILLQASDLLESLISDPDTVDASRFENVGRRMKGAMADQTGGPEPLPEKAKTVDLRPKATVPKPGRTLRVGTFRLDELANLAGELLIAVSTFEQQLIRLAEAMGDISGTRFRLQDSYRRLEKGFDIKALGKTGQGNAAVPDHFVEFDDMELDRYSELNLIIRDVGESVVDVGALSTHLSALYSDFDGSLNRQRVLLSELQEKLLNLRMTPMSTVANRFRRTVRDAAGRVGKRVDFAIHGERIELDRVIWEKISDPIMHLLRNAVDHGIEQEKERLAAGKPGTGKLYMSAARRGNQVVIEIQDDGGGLDHEAIRAKVKDMKLADKPDQLGPEELAAFIFHPGLSTKKDISQLSGRGVGMDVVRKNIQDLKGTIRVSSKTGAGMRLIIGIPLTLAVVRALIFRAKSRTFALALSEIKEILRIDSDTITRHPEQTVSIGDEILPIFSLSEVFGLSPAREEIGENPLVLVVSTGSQKGAMIIDELVGQREIVVKNLGTHLTYVKGISGATIMGDGSVLPILDPVDILASVGARFSSMPADYSTGKSESAEARIMVVDDSVSVREVVSRHIIAKGWTAIKAKDGLDALEKLETPPLPRLILLDVEMPRMNGYEFLGAVASDPALAAIPKVMLTSRASEKHRRRAMELGASGYILKPYTEKELMEVIAQYAGLKP